MYYRLDVIRKDITQLARLTPLLPLEKGHKTYSCCLWISTPPTGCYFPFVSYTRYTIARGYDKEIIEKAKQEYINTHEECGGREKWYEFIPTKRIRKCY